MQSTFKRSAHVAYFLRCLQALPSAAQGHDTNRITIAYFCLASLDLLGALESRTTEAQRRGWEEWVWGLQAEQGGFRGSTAMDLPDPQSSQSTAYNPPHLPSTYTALLVLALLRADMRRLDWGGLERFLERCAGVDGSFAPYPRQGALSQPNGGPSAPVELSAGGDAFQADARMAYCASVVADIIHIRKNAAESADGGVAKRLLLPDGGDDMPGKGKGKEVAWLEACQTWEGGYAQRPQLEAQGGTSYCCIAALDLRRRQQRRDLGRSEGQNDESTDPQDALVDGAADRALRWLVARQVAPRSAAHQPTDSEDDEDEDENVIGGGFQGRPGKDEDVCYSFWCGAAIRILSGEALFDIASNTQALLDAQSPLGGFGKEAGDYPDPLHSYLALAALAMNDADRKRAGHAAAPDLGLKELDPSWNISVEARSWLVAALQAGGA